MFPKWVRYLLLWMAIANLVLAVAIPLATSAFISLSYAVILGRYRELDVKGVIAHDRLVDVWGPEYLGNWGRVVDRLVWEHFEALYQTSVWVGAILAVNGMILIFAWWKIRRLHA